MGMRSPMMQAMAQQNPMMQQVMNNPQMMQAMFNPQTLQAMLQMQTGMQPGIQPGMQPNPAPATGAPVPGAVGAETGSVPAAGATPGFPGLMDPATLQAMQAMMGGMGGMGAMGGAGLAFRVQWVLLRRYHPSSVLQRSWSSSTTWASQIDHRMYRHCKWPTVTSIKPLPSCLVQHKANRHNRAGCRTHQAFNVTNLHCCLCGTLARRWCDLQL